MNTVLFARSVTPYLQGRWQEHLDALSPLRQEKALSCRKGTDAARSVCAGLLLQEGLEQFGIPRSDQQFVLNPWGKPELVGTHGLHFSLSHSGAWAVCAIADHPVGVDVELPRCSAAVARRYFHPQEAAYADDPDTLCRIWTAKEAFLKALGTGLTIPLSSFQVQVEPTRLLLLQTQSPLPYQLHEYIADAARICLCCTDAKPALTLL